MKINIFQPHFHPLKMNGEQPMSNCDDLTFHLKKLTFFLISIIFCKKKNENSVFPTHNSHDILIRLLICCFILFKENQHFIKFIFTPSSFKRHHVTIKIHFLPPQQTKKSKSI